jgi:heat shock protein HslJ
MKLLSMLAIMAMAMAVGGCGTTVNSAPSNETSLTGTHWKLVELNGKTVAASEGRREMFMMLDKAQGRVSGNSGCNQFGGVFQISTDGFGLHFGRMMMTEMACADMALEGEFLKVLAMTDSYHLNAEGLQLYKAKMAPLAKFVAVPDKATGKQ